jgi:hypothetical protein
LKNEHRIKPRYDRSPSRLKLSFVVKKGKSK